MSRNGRVVVAMSGGVDSSVAACLLKEQGYECIGVFLRVGAQAAEEVTCAVGANEATAGSGWTAGATAVRRRLKHGCCSATDASDARAVAGRLGIPFYALNFEKDFERIIDYFIDEYRRGRTPNPCVQCNIQVKFGRLLRYAEAMGAEYIATGHYARIVEREGRASLARSTNRLKDQTYVLFGIRREDLGRCLFPVGSMMKSDVRGAAGKLGLSVHDKPDSQEICFVPSNDYARFLHERAPETQREGEIVGADGTVLGRHEGIASFTIGQRRGLRLAVGRPIYVTALDATANRVTVGSKEDLFHAGLIADDVNWLVETPDVHRRSVEIKIRHMHAAAAGTMEKVKEGVVRAVFDEPQMAVTSGQAAVFYDGDVVLGGGWIRAALRERPTGQATE